MQKLDSYRTGCWIHIEDPTLEELTKISQGLKLETDLLQDALDIYEVPRLETEKKTIYIFTRVPYEKEGFIITLPLLFIINEAFLLTICSKHLAIFDKFLKNEIGFYTTQKVKLFIQIFSEVDKLYQESLTAIDRKIYNVSANIEKIRNRDINQFLLHERVINDFLNALNHTSPILNTLLSGKMIPLFEEDREIVEDFLLGNDQLITLCKEALQIVKNIRDTYSTILTNNLNRIMKFFASLTIILTIPMIVASVYGMNLKLPLAEHPLAFFLITGGATIISLILMIVFLKRDWL